SALVFRIQRTVRRATVFQLSSLCPETKPTRLIRFHLQNGRQVFFFVLHLLPHAMQSHLSPERIVIRRARRGRDRTLFDLRSAKDNTESDRQTKRCLALYLVSLLSGVLLLSKILPAYQKRRSCRFF